jgi:hypothetical protein
MRDRINVSIKKVNGEDWGDLNAIGLTHEICGEIVKRKEENYSFAGGHRVRLYQFKKNVHWKIPAEGQLIDIGDVIPATAGKIDQPAKQKKKK